MPRKGSRKDHEETIERGVGLAKSRQRSHRNIQRFRAAAGYNANVNFWLTERSKDSKLRPLVTMMAFLRGGQDLDEQLRLPRGSIYSSYFHTQGAYA